MSAERRAYLDTSALAKWYLWRLRRAVTAESASLRMLGGAAHAIDTRA